MLDEPEPPASDPWAESWTDEVPGIPESPPPGELDGADGRVPEAPYEPPSAPAYEPPPSEPEPMPADEPEPHAPAEVIEAPRIEPWSPDPDPWGAAWTVSQVVEEPIAEAPTLEDEEDVEAETTSPPTEDWGAPAVGAESPPAEDWRAAPVADIEAAPGWPEAIGPETEPPPTEDRGASAAATTEADGPPAEDWVEPGEPEPTPVDSDITDEPVTAETAVDVTEEPVTAEATDEPVTSAAAVDVTDELVPSATAVPPVETWEAGDEPAVEAEPAVVPPIWTAEPIVSEEEPAEPVEARATWDPDLWAEQEREVAAAAAPAEVEPVPVVEAEPEPEVAAAAAPAEVEPAPVVEAEPAPEEIESPISPEAITVAAAASRLGLDVPPDAPWREQVDPTEVLPTTWAPPPPPAPSEDAESEPRSGEIRTTLGRAEPEIQDELGEEPNTAEQAVPWLIGVILLLAGMVIVLLALIFAGDASLGGAGGSPSPTANALVPSGSADPTDAASTTQGPTTSPSATASAQPTDGAVAAPQYGDLEMVFQGRSAALAPIYLLRRDFTVEGDPTVVTQDPNLDVRRFAWSVDGTRGAALYVERLVGIDPGEDVHYLTDGISAITFGDNPETVYAVRVTADGGNDVASILAVDQATGDERELDRVRYGRPTIGEEAPLAEAQFSDDGGSVRLFWLAEDRLRLWILGAGAWTIHSTEGNATQLDEAELPLLWAPDGERRIGFSTEGNTTTIRMVDRSGDELARTTVTGRVSHLRWSPRGDQVSFTLGRSTSGGGVLQDLYLWNLGDGEDPAPMTNTGAAFGAEWVGSQARWEDS